MEIRVTIAIHLADIFNLGPSVSWPAKLHQRGAHVLGGPPHGGRGGDQGINGDQYPPGSL